ncbi:MAG TPA: phage holin family protein [Burkholderiales bacterium]|nr:phage holin family protein [Burkholderiales bacterium]
MLLRFFAFWFVNTLVLWVSDYLFTTVTFDSVTALVISGLVFGIAHVVLKPILVVLTLPITILTLGLFLLVINAVILLLVAALVPGFHIAGFWPAVWVGLFISIFSFVLNLMLGK